MSEALLSVRGLRVSYGHGARTVEAVRGVDLEVARGEVVALVGESGSGKSTTAHATVGLLGGSGRITAGSVRLDGIELTDLRPRAWRQVRGVRLGLVPQDPGVSLNPVTRVGDQIAEVLRIHRLANRSTARRRAVEILAGVGIADPEARARQYPHELSGGMRQRVLIGIALACRPELVIADEPTSALDVTVQRRVLDLLSDLTARAGSAVLFITHDLAVAADRADRIVVMKDGEVVEQGPAARILLEPAHPYTRRLVDAAPGLHGLIPAEDGPARTSPRQAAADDGGPGAPDLLEVRGLSKRFVLPAVSRGWRQERPVVQAVDDVSLSVAAGRTLALVGESGSGKSTTARLVLQLTRPDAGSVRLDGVELTGLDGPGLRDLRRRTQLVHQNPYASLDPMFTVRQIVDEPLRAHGVGDQAARARRVAELVDQVRLSSAFLDRRPAELSGGQRQRVAIARALALHPSLLVLDEPTSALDVSVQAQVLDLLAGLQQEQGVAYLFISHDLAVVRQIADSVVVLRDGRAVESGPTREVLDHPTHPYTVELIEAVPGRATRAARVPAGAEPLRSAP